MLAIALLVNELPESKKNSQPFLILIYKV